MEKIYGDSDRKIEWEKDRMEKLRKVYIFQ